MAYSEGNVIPYSPSSSPTSISPPPRRSSCQRDEKIADENEVVQGRILWLPPKDELPEKAVRRAHGKGAVEEGIYNHPVVIISRPREDSSVAHFHIITSFQGKKLHEIYGKANEFHASRRSWYLPIAPTPPHPDANSKKSKKRFPTLDIAYGATLRWDSYVNLRHVYKIDWSCLRSYANPDTPEHDIYRLERESMIRLLAKSRFLTGYESGPQKQILPLGPVPDIADENSDDDISNAQSPLSHIAPTSLFPEEIDTYPGPSSPFLDRPPTDYGSIQRPHISPPEHRQRDQLGIIQYILKLLGWPVALARQLWDRVLAKK